MVPGANIRATGCVCSAGISSSSHNRLVIDALIPLQPGFRAVKGSPSRGALTVDFLNGQQSPLVFLQALDVQVHTRSRPDNMDGCMLINLQSNVGEQVATCVI